MKRLLVVLAALAFAVVPEKVEAQCGYEGGGMYTPTYGCPCALPTGQINVAGIPVTTWTYLSGESRASIGGGSYITACSYVNGNEYMFLSALDVSKVDHGSSIDLGPVRSTATLATLPTMEFGTVLGFYGIGFDVGLPPAAFGSLPCQFPCPDDDGHPGAWCVAMVFMLDAGWVAGFYDGHIEEC